MDQIIIGAGTEYLLGLIIQLLGLDPVYAVENPGYARPSQVLRSHGRSVRLIGLDDDGMDIRQLAESDATAVYLTPSHHFPLGTVMPVERRMQLLRWAGQTDDRYLIEDDYDSEFRFSGRPIPALQGMDKAGKVIYLSTFSRSLAPSMRISFLVLPPRLLSRYREQLLYLASTVSRFEQTILRSFIQDGYYERHLNRMRTAYRERRDCLIAAVRQMDIGPSIDIIGTEAGLHLVLRVRGPWTERELVERAAAHGVRVHGRSEYLLGPESPATMKKAAGPPSLSTGGPDPVILMGFADFDAAQIENGIRLLNEAWML